MPSYIVFNDQFGEMIATRREKPVHYCHLNGISQMVGKQHGKQSSDEWIVVNARDQVGAIMAARASASGSGRCDQKVWLLMIWLWPMKMVP